MTPDPRRTPDPGAQRTRWLLGLGPLVLIAVLVGLFGLLNAPGIVAGDRIPQEELVVEDLRLSPGTIVVTVRNEGADPVAVRQVNVNDFFASFTQTSEEIGRLGVDVLTVDYDWVRGDRIELTLITSTGGTVIAEVDAAVASPEREAPFFALMVLIGLYVGVIPVAIGLLWLPFVRRASPAWLRWMLAFTVGLLAFLAVDATLEGLELAARSGVFGGGLVVFLGALVAYLVLEGVEGLMVRRRRAASAGGADALPATAIATLIAVGIGVHNLGEGLAIGAAYTVGQLALGAFLVIGFAIHNTTEGLAIVAPLAHERPRVGLLATLGLVAGAPAILGALLGAVAFQPSLAALLFGVGAGAVGQVAIKILPLLRDDRGRNLTPLTAGAMVGGLGFMFATSLLVVA